MRSTRPVALRFGQAFPIGTRLHRRLDAGRLEAAEFRVESGRVHIACPACNHVAPLGAEYQIDRGGTVTPLWSCPSEQCGCIQWLELGGYEME